MNTSNEMFKKKIFWKDVREEYFVLTHLHGFHEFSLSTSKIEKGFWLFIILCAFAFTGYLICQSIQESLEDRKQTVVIYQKYGNISLPVLYCPDEWIDETKIRLFNISAKHVLYSISYLRRTTSIYMDENAFLLRYDIVLGKIKFCDGTNSNERVFPALIVLAPYIEKKCLYKNGAVRDYNIPDYYGVLSRKLIDSTFSLTELVDTSNVSLMTRIFKECQNNQSEEVWKILYFEFFLSVLAKHQLENDKDYIGIQKRIEKCGKNEYYATLLTLHDLDNFINESRIICGEFLNVTFNVSFNDDKQTNLCSIYNDVIMFYMFNGDSISDYVCNDYSCKDNIHSKFERRRSNFISYIISTDTNYSDYLQQNGKDVSYETLKEYINIEIGGSFLNQHVELIKIRSWAEEKFKAMEKEDFQRFLNERNFTVFDIFKIISFDVNKFVLGMSVDPLFEIRPRYGNITVEKVINAFGVCYLFGIYADMKPVTELPSDFGDIDYTRTLNEKLYVNIIQLKAHETQSGRKNFLVIGNDAKDLIPRKNTFDVEFDYDYAVRNHYSFDVSNLAYQRRDNNECQENIKKQDNVIYTHNNCMTNCFNKYSKSKYIEGYVHQKAECQYIAESTDEIDIDDRCSYFSNTRLEITIDSKNMNDQEHLDNCNNNCQQDCGLMTFDVKNTKKDCSGKPCKLSRRGLYFAKYDTYSSAYNWFLNTSVDDTEPRPIWIKPLQHNDIGGPMTNDMILKIGDVYSNNPPVLRMEIRINSDVTTYVTSLSEAWYSYLGNVGGQINLVLSGSLLTIFQLIWWFSRYFIRQFRMHSPKRIREDFFMTTTEVNETKF